MRKKIKERFLILICGLPSTGKTTIAKKLANQLDRHVLISQNEIRRKMGIKRMPKTQENVLRTIDRLTAKYLLSGTGVVSESVNRHTFRRQQIYGVASACGRRVIVLEILCPEDVAKESIIKRPEGDNLISDPNDPGVYDRLKAMWEDVEIDFKFPGEDHVAYLQFDSEKKQLKKIISRQGMREILNQIEKILRT